jgi:hypothetical protein
MEENTENYTEISAEEFLKQLKYDYAPKYKIITNNIVFHFRDLLKIINLSIDSIVFNGTVNIELDSDAYAKMPEAMMKGYEYNPSDFNTKRIKIKIQNCIFKNKVIISNLFLEDISFRNTCFQEDIWMGNNDISNVWFGSSSFKTISMNGNTIGLLNSCDSFFSNALTIADGIFLGEFLILGGYFNAFHIHKGVFQKIQILRGFFKNFQISGGEFNNSFEIGAFGGDLPDKPIFFRVASFMGVYNEILFRDGIFNKGVLFESSIIIKKYCQFQNGIFLSEISINSGNCPELFFIFNKKLFINKIKLNNTLINTKYIYLEKSEGVLNNLILENTNIIAGTLIKISDIPINNITFNNSVNAGNIIFSGVKGKKLEGNSPTLKIHNSDLGKTTFIDCDFEEMNLDFKSSKITEVFLAGTKMPKEITTTDNDINVANEQKRLGYGQLKKIYDNRGDTVTANEYFAKEMNVFLKKKGIGVGEKINVGLNWLSSNHGTNWLQALGSTLLVAVFFFCLYGMSIGIYPTYKWNKQTSEVFYKYAGYFVEFINPFHKADYIPQDFYDYTEKRKIPISGLTRFIDGISRIFIAYFVYQLIQAFRKHRRGS